MYLLIREDGDIEQTAEWHNWYGEAVAAGIMEVIAFNHEFGQFERLQGGKTCVRV